MKAKTIKSILRRKLKSWCESIEDEAVRDIVRDNTIITGGSIVSLLLGEAPNDFDVYFRTSEANYKVAEYYLKKFKENPPTRFKDGGGQVEVYLADGYLKPLASFSDWKRQDEKASRLRVVVKSAGIASEDGAHDYQYFESANPEDAEDFVEQAAEVAQAAAEANSGKPPYRPVFVTSNAITLSDQIQMVVRFYGEAEEIHKNYDFVHCTNYWQSWDGKLVLRPEALECIINKELRYVGSKYPLCSIFRLRKFIKRGWQVNVGQILKAALQITELDLLDAETLEDQLIGVDAAYFAEVIELCRKRLEETKADRIDAAYLIEVIDRIF